MNVERMGARPSPYRQAVREQQRRKAEKTLVCPECKLANKPGADPIELDPYDDARCPCGNVFAVHVDYP